MDKYNKDLNLREYSVHDSIEPQKYPLGFLLQVAARPTELCRSFISHIIERVAAFRAGMFSFIVGNMTLVVAPNKYLAMRTSKNR